MTDDDDIEELVQQIRPDESTTDEDVPDWEAFEPAGDLFERFMEEYDRRRIRRLPRRPPAPTPDHRSLDLATVENIESFGHQVESAIAKLRELRDRVEYEINRRDRNEKVDQ